jgi:hypothetical protein
MLIAESAESAEPAAGDETSRPFTGSRPGRDLDGDFRIRLAYRIEIR